MTLVKHPASHLIGSQRRSNGQAPSPTFADLGLTGARCLLVASTGGHLAELERVMRVLQPRDDSAILTFDTPQSRSLEHQDVRFVPYIAPRDVKGIAVRARSVQRILNERTWDAVVSTGSAIALSALPLASARGIRSVYVESYSRFHGPSLTGRLLRAVPGPVELFTQHRSWSSASWRYSGSVMDSVRPATETREARNPRSVFVTLGTIRPFRFDALVDSVLRNLPAGAEIVWQLGSTTRHDLPGEVHQHMDRGQFLDAARRAGRVISHAGTGTAIDLIELGHRPILVPRRASRGEHIDDHQAEIVDDLRRRDLVDAREVDTLSPEDLAAAC